MYTLYPHYPTTFPHLHLKRALWVLGFFVSLILCYRYPFSTDAFISPVILLFAILGLMSGSAGIIFSLFKSHIKLSLTYTIGLLLYISISISMVFRGMDRDHLLVLLTAWLILLIYIFTPYKIKTALFRLALSTGVCTGIIIVVDNFVLQRNLFLSNIFGFETITEQAFLTCMAQLAVLQIFTQTHSRIVRFLVLILLAGLITTTLCLESRTGIIAQLCCVLIFMTGSVKHCFRIIYIPICLLIAVSAFGLKMESTSGRIFIYKTSLTMLDTPFNIFIGRGFQGFRNEYMPIQAQELKTETHTTRQRADEIHHPLNEFLNISINYGIITTLCLGIATWLVLHSIKLKPLQKGYLFTLIVFSLFTYPFRYPITWYSLAIFIASLSSISNDTQKYISFKSQYAIRAIIVLLIVIGSIGWEQWKNHSQWEVAFNCHRLGKWELADNLYEELNSRISTPEFAFNNAVHYMENGNILKALTAIESCKVKNYSTTMLEGSIRAMIGDRTQALELFTLAHNMCPNRFQPLFELYKLNIESGNTLRASEIANEILLKPIKIPSHEITKIIHYVQENETNQNHVASPTDIRMCNDELPHK